MNGFLGNCFQLVAFSITSVSRYEQQALFRRRSAFCRIVQRWVALVQFCPESRSAFFSPEWPGHWWWSAISFFEDVALLFEEDGDLDVDAATTRA